MAALDLARPPRRAEKAKFAYKNGYKLGAPAGCAAMAANMAAVDVGDPILACAAGPSLHHPPPSTAGTRGLMGAKIVVIASVSVTSAVPR